MEDHATDVLYVVWIPVEFNLEGLLIKTKMPGNKGNNLVGTILSNASSPIIWINKA